MKPFLRLSLLCLALTLLAPFTAFAADAVDTASVGETVAAQDDASATPAAAADPLSALMDLPEWTSDEVSTSFELCQGPPVLSCQCGYGDPGEPTNCCYCNQCWDGYVLALCGIDP